MKNWEVKLDPNPSNFNQNKNAENVDRSLNNQNDENWVNFSQEGSIYFTDVSIL